MTAPNQRALRAYLTQVIEPGDTFVGTLIQQVGVAEAITVAWHDSAYQGKYRPRMVAGTDPDAIAKWFSELHARYMAQIQVVIPGDPEWPSGLDDLEDTAPPALWVRGQLYALGQLDRTKSVGIVGARAASSYGEHIAHQMASDLAAGGIPVASGAAYGIDAAVHRATLAAGGTTVAFLAGGADRPYPAGNSDLIQRIAREGAVVSEVPPGSAPTKWRFLARNRLIAAATDATVVVEAGWRSGSLNTANHARGLSRPVGAVPGPVTSATSAGCHRLIRECDATLVTDAGDVRELMGLERG